MNDLTLLAFFICLFHVKISIYLIILLNFSFSFLKQKAITFYVKEKKDFFFLFLLMIKRVVKLMSHWKFDHVNCVYFEYDK